MTPAAGTALRAENASRSFRSVRGGTVAALEGVTLDVAPGEFLAVAGPSGCGKTTLLALLAALDRPSGGSVRHDGADLATASAATLAHLRRRVGVVFQAAPMLRRMALWENVTQGLVPAGVGVAARRRAAEEALARLGIVDLADRPPEELSGGERQRAAVARALVGAPRLLVADEPTSQLDEETARLVIAALEDARAAGATVVAATHDPDILAVAGRVVRLARGRLQ